jgi:arsenite oxidase small subunit
MRDDGPPFPVKSLPVSRREFLRIGCTTISGPLVAGMAPALASAAISKDDVYPPMDVVALDSVKEDAPVLFSYPDAASPAVLLRLRQSATNGIGPNNTIVAYSGLCTHKGCPVAFRPERKLLICPCHWSSFDPAKAGQMVIGQGSQSLPQIALRLSGKMIQATGVTGLIYGRETNIL